jgi:hypothetical protein
MNCYELKININENFENQISPLSSYGILSGPGIRNGDPRGIDVNRIEVLDDDDLTILYMSIDGDTVRMVTSNEESVYYKGKMSDFDPKKFLSYPRAPKGNYIRTRGIRNKPFKGKGIINGPTVNWGNEDGIPILYIKKLNNGTYIFIGKDNNDIKMVSEFGESKKYVGSPENFNPNNWNSYTADTGYSIKYGNITTDDSVKNSFTPAIDINNYNIAKSSVSSRDGVKLSDNIPSSQSPPPPPPPPPPPSDQLIKGIDNKYLIIAGSVVSFVFILIIMLALK